MGTRTQDWHHRLRRTTSNVIEDQDSRQGILFLLPTLILISVIVFIPAVRYGLLLSFKQYTQDPNAVNPWVGLQNYEYWLVGEGSSLLLFSFKMTLLYELAVVPLGLVVALAAALVMNESMPARPLFRGLLLAGFATPPITAGLLFGFMGRAESYGVLYNFVTAFFSISGAGLTTNTPWAFWTVVVAKVWRDFGFMYVVFLAGLQSVPSSLYQMAKVDGAGPIQRFRYITLPHLRTVIITVVMIRTVFTIGYMAVPWGVTRGGPINYTSFLPVVVFKQAFVNWALGRAAALGMILMALVLPLLFIWIKLETEDLD